MKKYNLLDELNNINDEYIIESLNYKMKRDDKMKSNLWLKIGTFSLAFACTFIFGFFLYKNYNNNKVLVETEITSNQYLTANYAMEMYNEFNKKYDLDFTSLNINEKKIIRSIEFMSNNEEYKYCSGNIEVKRLENDIIEYNISSDCDNKRDDNVELSFKIYSNLITNEKYQLINSPQEVENGFIGVLNGYKSDGHTRQSIDGIVYLDKELNTKEIKLFKNEIVGPNGGAPRINIVNNGFIVDSFSNEDNAAKRSETLAFYDEDLNLKWSKTFERQKFTEFGFESKDYYVFKYFNTFYYLSKDNGEIVNTVDLPSYATYRKDNNTSIEYAYYNDGLIFIARLGETDNAKIYIFDENINKLSEIEIPEVIPQKRRSYFKYYVNKKRTIVATLENLYIYDTATGNLINKLKTNSKHIENFKVEDDKFMLIYDGVYDYRPDGQIYQTLNEKYNYYESYDFEGNLIYSLDIDKYYGWNALNDLGIIDTASEFRSSTINHSTYLLGNYVFESFFDKNNNGTVFYLLYDYSNALLTQTINYKNYLGIWTENEKVSRNSNQNAIVLDITNNKIYGRLYLMDNYKFANTEIKMNGGVGTFTATTYDNQYTVKGTIELLNKSVKLTITEHNLPKLDNNTFMLTYNTDREFEQEISFNDYLGIWCENEKVSRNSDQNAANLAITSNFKTIKLYLLNNYRFAETVVTMSGNVGTFSTHTEDYKYNVSGKIELLDKKVKITITEHNLPKLDNNTFMLTYNTDKEFYMGENINSLNDYLGSWFESEDEAFNEEKNAIILRLSNNDLKLKIFL